MGNNETVVQFSTSNKNLSFPRRVQTGSENLLTSYSSGTVDSVTSDETAGGEPDHYL